MIWTIKNTVVEYKEEKWIFHLIGEDMCREDDDNRAFKIGMR